jgi:hypothetical protein
MQLELGLRRSNLAIGVWLVPDARERRLAEICALPIEGARPATQKSLEKGGRCHLWDLSFVEPFFHLQNGQLYALGPRPGRPKAATPVRVVVQSRK